MRWLLLVLIAAACGPADETDIDPICIGAPVYTWDDFGQAFLDANCQRCHASDSPDRNDAPASVTFDTEQDVAINLHLILRAATGDAPIMPPEGEGDVSDADRQKLEIWLTCYPPEL